MTFDQVSALFVALEDKLTPFRLGSYIVLHGRPFVCQSRAYFVQDRSVLL